MRSEGSTVVFDLDGTLLDGDSASAWMVGRFRASAWRSLLAVIALSVALPLTANASTRRIGGSIFLWIASVGLDEAALRRSFARFAKLVSSGSGIGWRRRGLDELETHLLRRETAVIATAAPAWLAECLAETLPFEVPVVGSSLSRSMGGWVARHHCRHEAKCDAIIRAGYGERWAIAYSDSADDGPLLARATSAFVINASKRTVRRLVKSGISVENLVW